MIYVMSDLHGCYDKYKKMLDKINLRENDTLYILGDMVDRGKDGIKILLDMMKRKNIVPLLGNHDYFAFSVLKQIDKENKPDWWNEVRESWLFDGGAPTEEAFMALGPDVQRTVLAYIVNFSIYETVEIGENTFVLSHAGIDNFEKAFEELCDEYYDEE